MSIMIDLPPAMAQEAQGYADLRGTTPHRKYNHTFPTSYATKGCRMKKKKKGNAEGNLERIEPYVDVQDRVVVVRQLPVILDADVAALYGVETKHVNQAVRNNRDKFPADYVFELTADEAKDLRSKFLTANPLRPQNATIEISSKSRYAPKAFTEKGLYMLATVLKSKRATAAAFAIIETFAKVRGLKRELVELHTESDKRKRAEKMRHFGETLTDIVMPDLETVETESSLELNFFIGKIKHTVRRIKRAKPESRG